LLKQYLDTQKLKARARTLQAVKSRQIEGLDKETISDINQNILANQKTQRNCKMWEAQINHLKDSRK
tara:strand:+ start:110 stop:310 length:201 start_codon:yes stop_codon:yes gene_type:complete